MGTCDFCGNHYDKTFTIERGGERYVLDSFECAIHLLAPICDNCGVRIIGHGFEADSLTFCSDHCARQQGIMGMEDEVDL